MTTRAMTVDRKYYFMKGKGFGAAAVSGSSHHFAKESESQWIIFDFFKKVHKGTKEIAASAFSLAAQLEHQGQSVPRMDWSFLPTPSTTLRHGAMLKVRIKTKDKGCFHLLVQGAPPKEDPLPEVEG